MKYSDLSKKVISLKNADLNLKNKLIEEKKLSKGYDKEMEALHIHNAEELENIIQQIGYPTEEKVGKEASEAAWLIIQHAISKPSFMKKCAELLSVETTKSKTHLIQLAYLTDRIAVFEDQAQLYGTQFDWDKNGELSPQPYDNLSKVNQRRQLIGLSSLQEQTQIIRNQAAKENQTPPKDLQKRKEEYDKWRKSVGWI